MVDNEKRNYKGFVENKLYAIKLYLREDGYYTCLYRITTNEKYRLEESSGRKILQRLICSFGLYIKVLRENQVCKIMSDLESIAEALQIPIEYVEELTRRYW